MSNLIFLDTADTSEIEKWTKKINVSGITTNQKIFSEQKGINFKETVLSICGFTKSTSIELTSHNTIDEMLKEAKKYASWNKNIVIKVPMTIDGKGLEVIKKLTYLKIKTNATVMVTFEQMLLAINAGATYASIFLNRSYDAGYDGLEIIKRSRNFIDHGNYSTRIITGSIRKKHDVGDAFESGSDIVTIPPKILNEMLNEEKTQQTILEFDAAWELFKGK